MVDLGGGLANERSERSFFLAIERISGIKSDKKKLGVTPHFSRSKILNNHQLGMNNPSIIYLTYLLIHPHPTNLQNKSTSSTCYCTHLLHPPPSANIRGKVQHPWILKKKKKKKSLDNHVIINPPTPTLLLLKGTSRPFGRFYICPFSASSSSSFLPSDNS